MDLVLDTNVVVSALRSRNGASFKLLSQLGTEKYRAHLTVPLFLEYEEQIQNLADAGIVTKPNMRAVLDYFCSVMILNRVHFLWRPFLQDADDDMVLEAAVAGGCGLIVTHNTKDFSGTEKLGIQAIRPGILIKRLEEQP